MRQLKLIAGVLSIPSLALWLFLLYKILEAVNASELMWFLYWIYLPIGILFQFLITAIRGE